MGFLAEFLSFLIFFRPRSSRRGILIVGVESVASGVAWRLIFWGQCLLAFTYLTSARGHRTIRRSVLPESSPSTEPDRARLSIEERLSGRCIHRFQEGIRMRSRLVIGMMLALLT